ncbi:MAG: GumC family protein [Candidatus Zixiibacteriota bacterium]
MSDHTDGSNFYLLLELLARRNRLILTLVLLPTLAAAVIAFVWPKSYQASALLLPPKNVALPVGGIAKLGEVVSVVEGLELPVMVTPSDVYARMLRSRTIARTITARFNLADIYRIENGYELYEELMDRSEFRVTDEGLLRISVIDRNPERAADIANAFVEELDMINREIALERAQRNRMFIQGRLSQVSIDLDSARSAFQTFQMKNKAVNFDEQTRLAIEQAGELKTLLAGLDIEISMARRNLGQGNTTLKELELRRETIQRQLDRLETVNADSSFFSLPIAAIPALRGEYQILYSRVRVAQTLHGILLEQYEQAKIQESEDMPTLSVLDRATPPEIRYSPKRTLIVGGTFGISLLFAIFLAAFLEYVARLKATNARDYERLETFASAFLGWLPGVGRTSGAKR